ncbi:serine/threonine-protein kinase [Nocardia alba]|uniref:Serine/threonine protein kinase n=1 Tax=Nocardia alba TaxID=225051 RepID=A0A4R1FZM0_9NOCA|nr:serine/threonine-protein kinase [Nocardia alba]TCK00734.1 serine/threonine protein kinase [Nocardia alba]
MQPLDPNDPRRIGDYRLLGVLGAGGMGKVYLGRNPGGRTVAVKVIRPDLIDAEFRARFRREVAAAKRVGGAFTAPVLDADVDARAPWLATGYVAGISLTDAVSEFGPFAEPALSALAHGLAEALVAVHAAGIVHRDLKPSNVMLAIDGPKVIDFGIARVIADSALTTTGKFLGSPGFMCPEQVSGETLSPACDVFALGGVLTFAAAGHGPFGTAEVMQMLWRIVYEEPRLEALPASLRPLVASCLAKDPAARPTPEQVLSELAHLGAPERSGWLPPQVLAHISTAAVRLLDLDSGPADPPGASRSDVTATSAPGWSTGSSAPNLPLANPPWNSATGPSLPNGHTATGGSAPVPYRQSGGFTTGPTTGSRQAAFHTGPNPAATGREFTPRPFVVAHNPAPPRATESRRTRALLIAAAATVAVAVAVGAYLIGTQLDARSTGAAATSTALAETAIAVGPTTTAPGTTATAPDSTVPGAATVATEFVGTWKGRAADGPVQFDIELTIAAGAVGQELATSANTGALSHARCARAETLTEARADRLTFRARLTEGSGCMDEGAISTVTLQSDGTLAYRTPGLFGGAIAGTLRKG